MINYYNEIHLFQREIHRGGLQSRLNIVKLVNKFCCEENNEEKGRINRIGSEESFLSDFSLPISCGNREDKRT